MAESDFLKGVEADQLAAFSPTAMQRESTGNIKIVCDPPEADIAWVKAQLAELPPDRVDDLLARFEKQLAGDLLHVAECPGSPTRDAGDLVVRFRIDGLRECFAAAVRAAQIDADGFHGASQ
jgi:hypothetical protein